MRILLLGGTSFVGRHIAEAALAAGHTLTFFNRGKTGATLFAEHPQVRGDRAHDAALLSGIEADAVIDTSGYTPDAVAASARAVAPRVRRYVFVSSISVYQPGPSIDETSPTQQLPDGASTSELVMELYGALKARCERELLEILGPERVVAVRAGLMVGPYDYTDRFTYWPLRVARGGEVLAPVAPGEVLQFIDARDLAAWVVGALARNLSGTYNVTSAPGAFTIGEVLERSRTLTKSDARFTYVPAAFLEEQKVAAWSDMPLWLPDSPEEEGLMSVSTEHARATGLQPRPLVRTIADVLAEFRARPHATLRAGLSAEREVEVLAAWHARS